jgi:hypothetical protein
MVGISFSLQEKDKAIVPGAQTERRGEAGPVSLGVLTGCFGSFRSVGRALWSQGCRGRFGPGLGRSNSRQRTTAGGVKLTPTQGVGLNVAAAACCDRDGNTSE